MHLWPVCVQGPRGAAKKAQARAATAAADIHRSNRVSEADAIAALVNDLSAQHGAAFGKELNDLFSAAGQQPIQKCERLCHS